MDSFRIYDVKIAKSRGISNFLRLRMIANAFRLIQVLVCLILISKLSTRLPAAAKISGEFFRELTPFLTSPRFVFFLGNAIIITLFRKSGHCSHQDPSTKASSFDLYQEFVEKSEKKHGIQLYEVENRGKQNILPEKRVCTDSRGCRRTLSENLKVVRYENSDMKLKRSNSDQKTAKYSYPEDCMSNEEFRNKIEAFIARQKRLQLDEEYQ